MRYRKHFNLYLAASIIAVFALALRGAEIPPLPGYAVHANGFTVPAARGDSGPYTYQVGIGRPNPSSGIYIWPSPSPPNKVL